MDRIIEIINEWDPIGFFPLAPRDEYTGEAKKILHFVSSNKSLHIEQLAQEINQIFINAFGSDAYEEDLEKCAEIAHKVLLISSELR